MKLPQDTHEKMMSAYQLLSQGSISVGTFENIKVLLKGIHPDLDENLDRCSKALQMFQKIQSGDIISLSAEHLPEKSEKEKKRKKALLFFISNIKNLQSEIKRIDAELSQGNTNNIARAGRIIKYAKGPFGLITLAAVVIVGIMMFTHKQSTQSLPVKLMPTGKQIQIIIYNNKQIPLSQLFVGHGPDCDSPHYHAIGETTVTALDGTILQDPGGCGFGKVKDVQIINVVQ